MALLRLASVPLVLTIVLGGCSSSTDDGASTSTANSGATSSSTSTDGGAEAAASTDPPQTTTTTDVGCGGSNAPACADGKICLVGKDCTSLSCQSGTCAAPTGTDGIENGDEVGVDCGGTTPGGKPCADGLACTSAAGCASDVCTGNVCQTPKTDDHVKNGDETGVDCGGPVAPRCADLGGCLVAGDCTSGVCTKNVCQVPTGEDNVKNGDESAVDCGGTTTGAKRCPVGTACNGHADCVDGCGEVSKVCVLGKSCVKHNGGETCGATEGGADNCCQTVALASSTTKIDKYFVTAGRMRAMIERLKGDVRTFVKGLPAATWSQSWNALVPSTEAEADAMLGSYWFNAPNDADVATNDWSKRSCAPGEFGGHTYFTAKNGDDYSDFMQPQLDPKALNCVGWHLSNAFCQWEGGRIATSTEIHNAFTNNGTTAFPWGAAPTVAGWPSAQDSHLNHYFSYGYPTVKGMRKDKDGDVLDVSWYVSPPGRFPTGNNDNGAADVAGDLLHWVSDYTYAFYWTGSWEDHSPGLYTQDWSTAWPGEPNGYYGIGVRCAHP